MQVCREKWAAQPFRQSSTPPRTSPLRVATNGPPGSSLLRMVLPSSSSVVVNDDHQRSESSLPLLPSGRPVPPFKPPGLFARTSGLLAAAAAAWAAGSEIDLSLSNGDGVDDLVDDDDEFDDDEEEWDDEYDIDDDDDDTAAAATASGVMQVINNLIITNNCSSLNRFR